MSSGDVVSARIPHSGPAHGVSTGGPLDAVERRHRKVSGDSHVNHGGTYGPHNQGTFKPSLNRSREGIVLFEVGNVDSLENAELINVPHSSIS